MYSNCILEILKQFIAHPLTTEIVNLKQYTSNRKGVHYGWRRKSKQSVIYHFASPGAGNRPWYGNILFKGKICIIKLDNNK